MLMNHLRNCGKFSTLVFADHSSGKLSKSTLKILNAAKLLNQQISLLVASNDASSVVDQIKSSIPSNVVHQVLVAQHDSFKAPQADLLGNLVKQLIDQHGFTNFVTSTSTIAKDFLPRVAVKYAAQPITDVIAINNDVFLRPVYAGNAIAQVKSNDKVKFISFRPTNFEEIQQTGDKVSNIVQVKVENTKQLIEHVSDELVQSDKPELTTAKFIVSGGRALGSKENFKILDELANALGNTAIGASRAAVDAGYAANDQQVGQTGKVVAPELYIAVGISGAIQHLAGMKDSKVIVAINKDQEAPIVSVADYTIVDDLFKVVPELTKKIKEIKQ
ncbi:unnamed protein product (macronuclear) [Paramecium tetraurelia]|uniref:Electron transfer flavoprotein subunit alpha n=1 Tax=Paramecium tetraurelia TaxID=5888 RepID=A0DEE1_PARTE|nr:uncharacterized protein GSPATT00016234001 [Paramecium tetraurelia]CAK81408.1 unnamed protein product [Paramecium tetraurelia]|eukprot:XP_001448805.1 hypothetical protein (macronuclear) [Paramecium tetraurelia strain d4-2]